MQFSKCLDIGSRKLRKDMTDISWLASRPIAHRGYHDAAAGSIENSLSAVQAAIDHGFSIEVDLRSAADGVPVVFHDDVLDRLTDTTGPVHERTVDDLSDIALSGSPDRIPCLTELLDVVRGRVGLVIEIKSDFRPNASYVERIATTLSGYHGPVAVMSFDPDLVASLRRLAPNIPRGIVSCGASPRLAYWRRFTLMERFILRHLLHAPRSRPDFIAYDIDALPAISPLLMRAAFGRPLLTWTVRTKQQRLRAARWTDQIIFEGFDADTP